MPRPGRYLLQGPPMDRKTVSSSRPQDRKTRHRKLASVRKANTLCRKRTLGRADSASIAKRLLSFGLVGICANYVGRVLSKENVTGDSDTHCLFGIHTHLLGVHIYRPILRLHDLVLEAADLGSPLFPNLVEK